MKCLNAKSSLFSESRIREMTILSNQYHAINLAQGFPEFDPPLELLKALEKTALTGPHQYAPNWGADDLRKAIAAKQTKYMQRQIDFEKEIMVTCGSTEAMMSVMLALFNPGDKVIIFSPYYNSYVANAVLVGAEPLFVSLKPPEFSFSREELEKAFQQNPKALILCNPSNPSGKVFKEEELLQIAELAEKYDAYVITDEVYEHLVYPPNRHIYFASLPRMFERTISCSSLSKTYSITGWRLGYITAPFELLSQIRKFHDFLTVSAPSPLQHAAVTALEFSDDYYRSLTEIYLRKRDLLIDGLEKLGFRCSHPQGTYFALVDISEFKFESDLDFCKMLVKDYGVAAVPGSCFFAEPENRYIRLHFAKNDETIRTVLSRFQELKRRYLHA